MLLIKFPHCRDEFRLEKQRDKWKKNLIINYVNCKYFISYVS